MISLTPPITISPAPINGKAVKPIVLNEIDWVVIYDSTSATALVKGVNVHLRLWDATTTPSYTDAGQFTDADVNARVEELLGEDIAASITALFPKPSTPPAGSPARQVAPTQ